MRGNDKSQGQDHKAPAQDEAQENAPAQDKDEAAARPSETGKLPSPTSPFATAKLEMTPPPDFYLDVGMRTDRGRVREDNEDSELVWKATEGPLKGGLFVVADGMGGHAAGDVASRMAVQALEKLAESNWPGVKSPEEVRAELGKWIQLANQAVFDAATLRYNGMGTTVTAALVLDLTAYVANVGDSRTYLWHDGSLQRLTRDHSLVMRLVEAKVITPEEIYTHPRRNEIYRALGLDANVDVDVLPPIELASNDRLLLCCDGLWEMVHDPEIEATLARIPSAQAACDELVRMANVNGGVDNISVVIIRVL